MMRLAILLASLLLPLPVTGQDVLGQNALTQDVLALTGTVVDESEPDRTLISKPGWLRGLHVIGKRMPDAERPQILTLLPEGWLGTTVCARITTIGGDYVAMVEYTIPDEVRTRRARFDFETSYTDIITSMTPQNSGIALQKGACIGDTETGRQEYAANFWNEQADMILNPQGEAELWLNMNIARADELVADATLAGPDGVAIAALAAPSCIKIDRADALAFNFRCQVFVPPVLLAENPSAQVLFGYTRLYRGRDLKRRDAVIYVGAGQ